jgi:hypothetical protein
MALRKSHKLYSKSPNRSKKNSFQDRKDLNMKKKVNSGNDFQQITEIINQLIMISQEEKMMVTREETIMMKKEKDKHPKNIMKAKTENIEVEEVATEAGEEEEEKIEVDEVVTEEGGIIEVAEETPEEEEEDIEVEEVLMVEDRSIEELPMVKNSML